MSSKTFLYIEPGIEMESRLLSNFGFSTGLGFRITTNSNIDGLKDEDFNRIFFYLSAKWLHF
ncbi:MAG: hypothetical protein GY730_09895 [bacterium]|nr:hypothetical protein [bacterium]